MKISVGLLKDHELQLAYHLATGYSGFDFFPTHNCWRAEKKVGDFGLTVVSIIAENCRHYNRAYQKNFSAEKILEELRDENIGLKWDDNKNYVLYYQAFPEITATHSCLATAFMMVVVKKELGDVLSSENVESINLFKTKTKSGTPI